jgi:hypothetical protein
MPAFRDITGNRLGRLTVLGLSGRRGGATIWSCRCDCGTVRDYSRTSLGPGRAKSCGCLTAETATKTSTKHGAHKTREYAAWCRAKSRCENVQGRDYPNWGGRGIKMCERWRDDFAAFLADMGLAPPRHSPDRINNDRDYEPGNCRWAAPKTQLRNKRNNRYVMVRGEKMSLAEAAERHGINYQKLRGRLNLGWSIERALDLSGAGDA